MYFALRAAQAVTLTAMGILTANLIFLGYGYTALNRNDQ